MAAGMMGAMAIMAALMRRQRGEAGPIRVDVSMADAALALMSGPASRYLIDGVAPQRIGTAAFAGSPGGNVFRTARGWLATAANNLGQFERLCGVLGHPEWATAPEWLRLRPSSPAAMLRDCGTPHLEAALQTAFLDRDAAVWEQDLAAVGVPAAAVRSPGEFLDGAYRETPGFSTRLPSGAEVLGRASASMARHRCRHAMRRSWAPIPMPFSANSAWMPARYGRRAW